ncbi:MAG: DoxX family protein [Actinomycetes bacterium]
MSRTPTGTLRYIDEPRAARWLFGSTQAAWIWLLARLWLGWEWLQAGWGKVFGGTLTWRVWDWGDPAYALTGDGNIGWVRSGTVVSDGQEVVRGIGDSVAGFAQGAIAASEGPHPDVAFSWYVNFLEWIRDSAHPVFGPTVAVGELLIGLALILGLFTGLAAFLGSILNFSFVFAGSAGVNPAMILIAGAVILAWRNAGWYGLDRFALPALGTPWKPGELFEDTRGGTDRPAARQSEGKERQTV